MTTGKTFVFDKENPLARAPGESVRANEALQVFWSLPYPHTFAMLVKKLQETSEKPVFLSYMKKLASLYHWHERIAQQRDNDAKVMGAMFVSKRAAQIEAELEDAHTMRARALEVLKMLPVVEQQYQDKTGHWIIKPASSSEYNAAAKMLVESSRLARLALNMPTATINNQMSGRVDSDLTSGGKPIMFTGQVADDERQDT